MSLVKRCMAEIAKFEDAEAYEQALQTILKSSHTEEELERMFEPLVCINQDYIINYCTR